MALAGWQVAVPLDAATMHQAAQHLVGRHDFTSFRASQCQAKSALKTLESLDVERAGDEIRITARARSFLHHQVRNMVGSLKLVGEGKWSPDDLKAALVACDRSAAGPTASSRYVRPKERASASVESAVSTSKSCS